MYLNSSDYYKLCRSWNTAVKIIWDLLFNTHTRLLESLSPVAHLESVLAGRYVGFVHSLSSTSNPVLGLIFNQCKDNVSTQTGNNIKHLMENHGLQSMKELINMRSTIKYKRVNELQEEEQWKIDIIYGLVLARKGLIDIDTLEVDELEDILKFICSS